MGSLAAAADAAAAWDDSRFGSDVEGDAGEPADLPNGSAPSSSVPPESWLGMGDPCEDMARPVDILREMLASPDALSLLAPDPTSVPIPRMAVVPAAECLPLPFLWHSGLPGFIIRRLRFLEQPLGDPGGYIATVRFLWHFQWWSCWHRWHLL